MLAINAAFVYGSFASRKETARSDIDLMIISDRLTYADVYRALESAGKVLGRQINPTIYSRAEFSKRLKTRNPFVTKVMRLPKAHDLRNRTEYEGSLTPTSGSYRT